MIARLESSKGASYIVRKDRGLWTSWSAKCSVSTCKELSRRNFSLAEIDLKVAITSPFILCCKQAIFDASISALARASKTDFAVLLAIKTPRSLSLDTFLNSVPDILYRVDLLSVLCEILMTTHLVGLKLEKKICT